MIDKILKMSNKKIQLPAPENIQLYTWYTFNINPADVGSKNGLKVRIKSLRTLITELCTLDISYKCCPELSASGKLHVHGTIKFHSNMGVILFYANVYENSHKFSMEIDTIEDTEKWDDYVTKQMTKMKPTCKYLGVKYVIKFSSSIYDEL